MLFQHVWVGKLLVAIRCGTSIRFVLSTVIVVAAAAAAAAGVVVVCWRDGGGVWASNLNTVVRQVMLEKELVGKLFATHCAAERFLLFGHITWWRYRYEIFVPTEQTSFVVVC